MPTSQVDPDISLRLVSRLIFSSADKEKQTFLDLSHEQFQDMLSLANSHHVVMRSMEPFLGMMAEERDDTRSAWATAALDHEKLRINRAIAFLAEIHKELVSGGCGVTVIKSLDHWPDLGSDLDLYTSANPADVIRIMEQRFDARVADRSWGDRLANKWNFMVPGLPELIEVHMGRMGQTGELIAFARSLAARGRPYRIGAHFFQVPAAEDRLMICTLQRMYRHFYIRLCDIVDSVELLESDVVDFDDLYASSQESGIWEGVATFLNIVSDYAERWRGHGVALPESVKSAAQFGGDQITFARGFLRVPILPHSIRLYASEWTRLMSQGQLRSTVRLSLLPWLATAAAVGQKITGSDKGIW